MYKYFKSISQFLRLPAVCSLCLRYHNYSGAICKDCSTTLHKTTHTCPKCALPMTEENAICAECRQNLPWFDHIFAAYVFEEPLRTLLHRFKYHREIYLANTLAELFMNRLPQELRHTQCIIPVPLHPLRLKSRGYNQSAMIAQIVASKLGIPCELFLCKKILNTDSQARLDKKARLVNLKDAFYAKINQYYHHVTLIDDLVTTGTTVNEIARVLKEQHRIAIVNVWCIARAPIIRF